MKIIYKLFVDWSELEEYLNESVNWDIAEVTKIGEASLDAPYTVIKILYTIK